MRGCHGLDSHDSFLVGLVEGVAVDAGMVEVVPEQNSLTKQSLPCE